MDRLVIHALLVLYAVSVRQTDQTDVEMDMVMDYLEWYHYMGMNNPDPEMHRLMKENRSEEAKDRAIRTYQRTWNLTETGTIDEATYNMMMIPRCGMSDINTMEDVFSVWGEGAEDIGLAAHDAHPRYRIRHSHSHARHRQRRYAISGHRHDKLSLTYSMESYPKDGPENHEVDEVVDEAFRIWQSKSPLTFARVYGDDADIVLYFKDENHIDYENHGDLNDIAHAFYPNVFGKGSQIHYNNIQGKSWVAGRVKDRRKELNLLYVTLHEIGHALGMKHVLRNKRSIMYPYYRPAPDRNITLDDDDIRGIRRLYSEDMDPTTLEQMRNDSAGMAVPMQMNPKISTFCEKGTIDAITSRNEDGVDYVYAFQGDMYVRMRDGMVEMGFPKYLRDDWPDLPVDIDSVDAAYNVDAFDGKLAPIILVHNGTSYTYDYNKPVAISTESLTPRNPQRDAIFVKGDTGTQHHIANHSFMSFSNGRVIPWMLVSSFLPFLEGIPISAAFSKDRRLTYFFSGAQYYVVSFLEDQPMLLKGYPKSIAENFLHCNTSMMMAVPITALHASSSEATTGSLYLTRDTGISQESNSVHDLVTTAVTAAGSSYPSTRWVTGLLLVLEVLFNVF